MVYKNSHTAETTQKVSSLVTDTWEIKKKKGFSTTSRAIRITHGSLKHTSAHIHMHT